MNKSIVVAALVGGFALAASLGVAQAFPSLKDPDSARPHVETNEDVMLSPWTPNTQDDLTPYETGTRTFIVPNNPSMRSTPNRAVRVVPQEGVLVIPQEEVVIVPMR